MLKQAIPDEIQCQINRETSNTETMRQEIAELEPLPGNDKVNVLVLCNAGKNRSKLVADILQNRGYKALNKGAFKGKPNAFTLDDLEQGEFQAVIFVNPLIEEEFYKRLTHLTGRDQKSLNVPTRTLNMAENSGIRGYSERKGNPNSEIYIYPESAVDQEISRAQKT